METKQVKTAGHFVVSREIWTKAKVQAAREERIIREVVERAIHIYVRRAEARKAGADQE